MLSIMVILLPIMGVYTGLARLNYQKEEWVVHYSRPLNICVLVILSIYIYIYIYIYTHTHKSTSTGNRMFQWLQKLVPLKHLSSEHMIYVQKLKDRNEELEFLKDTFIANDFPINIIDV